jgi:hypothetical protein
MLKFTTLLDAASFSLVYVCGGALITVFNESGGVLEALTIKKQDTGAIVGKLWEYGVIQTFPF